MQGNIDKIKAVLAFPLSLHMAYDKAKADGKFDASDVGFLIDPVTKLVPAIQGAKEALEQIKDLDQTERQDIDAWAVSTYDIADDALEKKVEGAVDVLLSIAVFVGELTAEQAQAIKAA